MTYLPHTLLALGFAVVGYLAYKQWGARGAIAVAVGAITALAAFWPRKRAPVPPPPAPSLKPVHTAGMVMIARDEDKKREAIREADADELARRMGSQE